MAAAAVLATDATATAATFLSPSKAEADVTQLFTLAVETSSEKAGQQVPISQVELFVPSGFTIESFAPTPGWEQDWTIQSVQKATWTREEDELRDAEERVEASEQDGFFHFLGRPDSSKTYAFTTRVTYADGEVEQWGPKVDWPGGPKEASGPGPSVVAGAAGQASEAETEDGSSTLAIVALIVAALAFVTAAASVVLARRR